MTADAMGSPPTPGRASVIRKILWPAKEPFFILIGSAIGLLGDLGGLVAERFRPDLVAWLFVAITAVLAVMCARRAMRVDPDDATAVEAVVRCIPCDLMRCGIFAVAAFSLLAWIGQGDSGVAAIGTRLGVIEAGVKRTEANTDRLVDAMRQQIPIENAATPAEHFHNAWVYQTMRNDSARAAEEISAVYANGASGKIDAAQLYLDAHSARRPREQVRDEMVAMGRRLKDPALLVIAARAAQGDRAVADGLMAEARTMDPTYPFALHDPMVVRFSSGPMNARAQQTRLEGEVKRLEEFIRLYEAKPADHWAYLPRFMGDPAGGARTMIDGYKQTIETYRDINSGALARRVREQARRDMGAR